MCSYRAAPTDPDDIRIEVISPYDRASPPLPGPCCKFGWRLNCKTRRFTATTLLLSVVATCLLAGVCWACVQVPVVQQFMGRPAGDLVGEGTLAHSGRNLGSTTLWTSKVTKNLRSKPIPEISNMFLKEALKSQALHLEGNGDIHVNPRASKEQLEGLCRAYAEALTSSHASLFALGRAQASIVSVCAVTGFNVGHARGGSVPYHQPPDVIAAATSAMILGFGAVVLILMADVLRRPSSHDILTRVRPKQLLFA
ncbi:hypothetical protein WJX84_002070 [Apatococcus fuscideae]|uniref:Uncharacterized protein n=1 Tax=Apatococcus fuscideae TaxID=2026836 RepID=A0AAW1RJU3_9CHLO